jgi:toxin ParE1/3/4
VAAIRSHPEADVETESAALWYEAQQDGLGQDFLAELEKAFTLISESPTTWPLWPGVSRSLGIRRFLLSRFPYGVAYDATDGVIVVYAVAHLARRPGYWKDRLTS